MAAMQLTRTHRILVGVVIFGAVIIAAIGFAGSYAAVRVLAEEKGFGRFSLVFPIGIDAGICVLLALDLLLTWIRIPFPLLRQSAWILTAATIAFNGAAAWPDPLGVGMHAVIPLLFIVSVEAARHAVGRIADITADKHMEGVRLTRWLLSPGPTFMLWRRMKLWELRSYEQVIKLEQDRLIYQSRLQARFGRNWRRKAPIEALMPLRLAKYGVPLADTAASGLAAAGIEPVLLPPAPPMAELPQPRAEIPATAQAPDPEAATQRQDQQDHQQDRYEQLPSHQQPEPQQHQQPQGQAQQHPQPEAEPQGQPQPQPDPQFQPQPQPVSHTSPWFAAPQVPEGAYEGAYNPTYVEGLEPTPVMIPSGPGRSRPLGGVGVPGPRMDGPYGPQAQAQTQAEAQAYQQQPYQQPQAQYADQTQQPAGPSPAQGPVPASGGPDDRIPEPPEQADDELPVPGLPDDVSREEAYFGAFRKYVSEHGDFPNARQFGLYLMDLYGVTGRTGGPLSESSLRTYLRDFRHRFQSNLDGAEHIA
ncbi:DUF2637 domain-containing protein [Streptomyces odonnellii]|uniref:DUF2637 domain-containing protein n=1 Tax=Streptomyces odonnellii TaxID=1417980 RepID=UPI000626EAA2|nr:DUF2637 domain-containing protein [Streptomyces odonnellii]